MSERRDRSAWRSGLVWLPLALVVIAADQWSKSLIVARFEHYAAINVLPFLDIVRLHNPGAAFSFLADAGGWQRWFFTVLALGVSGAILWWLRGIDARRQALLALGLALVFGGAI
ncbi:MAG: signal peptidase II, partial [Steroidobacteraceae bacterium]|nr:signal peptidase II [Steroidobacteraceae bacterium]